MIRGELSTMTLADLLQWVDASRLTGVLRLERDGDTSWLALRERTIVGAGSPPNRPVTVPTRVPTLSADEASLDESTLATEHLHDQFLDSSGTFVFEPDAALPNDGVSLDLSIAELLMESLRLLDEWNRIDTDYSNDSSRLTALGPLTEKSTGRVQRAIYACAKNGLSVSETRLRLGLSRPATLRRIDELRALGYLRVDGVPGGEDLGARLLLQAKVLLDARQFDEAAHVFGALLSTDPSATHVRRLLVEAEREHVEYLRARIPTSDLVIRTKRKVDPGQLTASERSVLDRINGRWDVGIIVMVSPLRETETLKCLAKLHRLGAIAFTAPAPEPS
jgi:DNA-binding Lrp family transcriptional regulator